MKTQILTLALISANSIFAQEVRLDAPTANDAAKTLHASCGEVDETFDTHTGKFVKPEGAVCLLSGGFQAQTVLFIRADSLPKHTAEILEGGVGVWNIASLTQDASAENLIHLKAATPADSAFKNEVVAQVVGTQSNSYIANPQSISYSIAHDDNIIGFYKVNALKAIRPMSEANYVLKLRANAAVNKCLAMLRSEVSKQNGALAIIDFNQQEIKVAAGLVFISRLKDGESKFSQSCVSSVDEI